jgi:hypothetical protein
MAETLSASAKFERQRSRGRAIIPSYGPSNLPPPKGIHPDRALRETKILGRASMALRIGGLGRNISLKSPFYRKAGPIGFPQHL